MTLCGRSKSILLILKVAYQSLVFEIMRFQGKECGYPIGCHPYIPGQKDWNWQ
jgi:hypothetical protein